MQQTFFVLRSQGIVPTSTDPPRDADGTIGDDPWGKWDLLSPLGGCRTRFSWVAYAGGVASLLARGLGKPVRRTAPWYMQPKVPDSCQASAAGGRAP